MRGGAVRVIAGMFVGRRIGRGTCNDLWAEKSYSSWWGVVVDGRGSEKGCSFHLVSRFKEM